MAEQKVLTDAGIRALINKAKKQSVKIWRSDAFIPRSHGGLELYVSAKGIAHWAWRYAKADGSTTRIPMGLYSPQPAVGAFTLSEARAAIAPYVDLYLNPQTRDVRAYLERERTRQEVDAAAKKAAATEAEMSARVAKDAAEKYSLQSLLSVYVEHLRSQQKESAANVENMFANHVSKAFPELAARPANSISPRDIVMLLRALVDAKKGRTAAKLRSYLAAAYALAAKSALEADAPAAFLPFAVESNPARETGALSKYSRARERTLSEPELRQYWKTLKEATDSPSRDALVLGLVLGGQRPAQLLRATVSDVDVHARVLRLHDPKGKRKHPRLHSLPLTDLAVDVIQRCVARAEKQEGKWLFSSNGRTHLRLETASGLSNEIMSKLLNEPKPTRVVHEPFQLRDIRRTCETMLARLGVSKDIRAQIASHGISGVQAKHYDFHDYMAEKSAALHSWALHLEAKLTSNVALIKTAA